MPCSPRALEHHVLFNRSFCLDTRRRATDTDDVPNDEQRIIREVLKFFPIGDDKSRRRFLKEITALRNISHPNIAKVEGFFLHGPKEARQVVLCLRWEGDETFDSWYEKLRSQIANTVDLQVRLRPVIRGILMVCCISQRSLFVLLFLKLLSFRCC